MELPARFTVGMQNQVQHFAGETRDRSFTLEARYALANWNKLPLKSRYLRRISVWPPQRLARFGRACAPDLARLSSLDRMGDEHFC